MINAIKLVKKIVAQLSLGICWYNVICLMHAFELTSNRGHFELVNEWVAVKRIPYLDNQKILSEVEILMAATPHENIVDYKHYVSRVYNKYFCKAIFCRKLVQNLFILQWNFVWLV